MFMKLSHRPSKMHYQDKEGKAMFGSSKVQGLESQIRELTGRLEKVNQEKADLARRLEAEKARAAEVERKLMDTDFERLKEEARVSQAEYEGLKDLYTRKVQAFDSSKEEEEQNFAREAAVSRYNLKNEINAVKSENQGKVAGTVQTFIESYNYYLNQIKLLMDALGNVTVRMTEGMFDSPQEDLKANFGLQMVEELKAKTETISQDSGDLIVIGAPEEKEEPAEGAETEAVEEAAEGAEAAVEAAAEEKAEEAVEEAAGAVEEAAESAEEAVTEAVEEVTEAVEEKEGDAAEAAK